MAAPPVNLRGKVACVTGGGTGLGRAIARALAEAGADLAIIGRRPEPLAETAKACEAYGVRARPAVCDITDSGRVDALFDQIQSELGGPHILINNAGISRQSPILELENENWDDTLATNLSAVFYCCRAAGRFMVPAREGKVINIGSSAGSRGRPNQVAYAATKAGISGFTKALAVEWAPYNIQVNCLAPGRFATEMTRARIGDKEANEWFLRTVPMNRNPEPEEIQGLALFLASDQSSFMTGQTIYLDGGSSAI
ncbi:MAG: 3-oxoacyl-ACP reductase FabG [bacterium]|nr:3-oxoacyl-ACP reductase FabG [bacterium]